MNENYKGYVPTTGSIQWFTTISPTVSRRTGRGEVLGQLCAHLSGSRTDDKLEKILGRHDVDVLLLLSRSAPEVVPSFPSHIYFPNGPVTVREVETCVGKPLVVLFLLHSRLHFLGDGSVPRWYTTLSHLGVHVTLRNPLVSEKVGTQHTAGEENYSPFGDTEEGHHPDRDVS